MAQIAFAFLLLFHTAAYAGEPVIGRVALHQKSIDLSKDEHAVIEFQLSEKAHVDLEIYDESTTLVRKLIGEKVLKKGNHALQWDGRNEAGEQVSSGVYLYVLHARGEKPFRYDPSLKTGGEEVYVEKLSWDVPKGVIHYLLPRASYIRIRIGLKEGVFLGTLKDWTPLEAGEKEFPWNGQDPSGHFDLSNHPEAQINIAAFALPDNAVIVRSPSLQDQQARLSSLRGSKPGEAEAISRSEITSSLLGTLPRNDGYAEIASVSPATLSRNVSRPTYIHSRHPRHFCHEPQFKVEFPNAPMDQETQLPLLKGNASVRITLDPKDKDYFIANRFEVMFFIDSVFVFEQEEAASPMTIDLDSRRMGPGEHLLTVNLMDYEDHIGVQTLKVAVTEPPSV